MQSLSSVHQGAGIFFLQVATSTAAYLWLVLQIILLYLYWLPNDLQKSRERERMANVLSLLPTRGQTVWRPSVLCLQHYQSFCCLSFQSPLQSNQIFLEVVNVQTQGNYIRSYFNHEQHIKFWILPLLQISTMKFFTSLWLMMSRHLGTIICFLSPFWKLNLRLSRH